MQDATNTDFIRMPLFQQVRDKLMDRIKSGNWRAGQMLPNEVDLAREYNVSSGTIRKALDLLEFQHVLTRKQGRGTFICGEIEYDTLSEKATLVLASIGATISGSRIRLPNGKLMDANGLRELTEGIFDTAAWLEKRMPVKAKQAA